jgi:predicted aldo/keto reductase-like oxidoreductase
MLMMFFNMGYNEIDKVYNYSDVAAEEIVGRILIPERRRKVYPATKANPLGGGGLWPENSRRS